MPVIYLRVTLLQRLSWLPLGFQDEPPLFPLLKRTDILTIAPQRVYLVSLQPNCTCFLLHLSYPHGWRMLSALLLYGVRTFLPPVKREINKPIFSRLQRYINFTKKAEKADAEYLNCNSLFFIFLRFYIIIFTNYHIIIIFVPLYIYGLQRKRICEAYQG